MCQWMRNPKTGELTVQLCFEAVDALLSSLIRGPECPNHTCDAPCADYPTCQEDMFHVSGSSTDVLSE